jgi:ABC-type multidrug transport system ATPase subunit
LGQNGSGKSTILEIMALSKKRTKGSYQIDGSDVYKEKCNYSTIRKKIGYCPQYNVFWDELTVDQNLLYIGRLLEI